MKLSNYIINFLISNKITHIFEVCGGALAHLLDSLYERKSISTISMHHEMAAAIAAEGYARASGNIGVAMATSGPGATGLITGIGSCFFDSIPCLFITGQVNTYEFKFNKPIRQIGFQEMDIVNIVKPIIKKAILIKDTDKIKYDLQKLLYIAKSDRPGPVLLDIPMNIQRADINPDKLQSFKKQKDNIKTTKGIDNDIMKKVIILIKSSSRPIILAGGGFRLSGARDELLKFIKKTEIPIVTSLMGLDVFPHNSSSFVGMLGSYGNRYANLAVANADLLLVLGSRLDTRQTGTRPKSFARGAKIIHVDVDPHELNSKIKANIAINIDLKDFLIVLNKYFNNYNKNKIEPWRQIIKNYKNKYPSYKYPTNNKINPNFFMHKLSDIIPKDALICVDVGQIQMWAAQSLEIKKSQRFLTQGGMGAMGSALPMAIGASFAKPGKIIVVITGDGGFQLNIQELQTVFHHKLPIKIVLLNNKCYGMVRQFQEQYFGGRFQSTVVGYSAPDFQKVVSAYQIPSMKISTNGKIENALHKLFNDRKAKFLEVSIDLKTPVYPKLSVNKPIEDQDPLLPRDELRSNMIIKPLKKNKDEN
ncbi:thiamine pyrophosphate-binding protein [bacterium]|nr:thiamine pyrophosphate-binding protein [bacterium]